MENKLHSVTEHLSLLQSWEVSHRIRESISNSCLYKFASCTPSICLDQDLVSYFISCYDHSRKAFIVRGHKLYLGVEDIFFLTGLPLDGLPIIGKTTENSEISQRLLTEVPPDVDNGFVNLCWLKTNFALVPENCLDIEPYIKAYYLFVIGCLVCPIPQRCSVPIDFLYAMEDTTKINDYAWGSAVFAHIQFALKHMKREHNFSANCLVIQLFAMERLPEMTKAYFGHDLQSPTEVPLCKGWGCLLSHSDSNSHKRFKVGKWKQVAHNPYSRIKLDEEFLRRHPDAIKHRQLRGGKFYVNGAVTKRNWIGYYKRHLDKWCSKKDFQMLSFVSDLNNSAPSASSPNKSAQQQLNLNEASLLNASSPNTSTAQQRPLNTTSLANSSSPSRSTRQQLHLHSTLVNASSPDIASEQKIHLDVSSNSTEERATTAILDDLIANRASSQQA